MSRYAGYVWLGAALFSAGATLAQAPGGGGQRGRQQEPVRPAGEAQPGQPPVFSTIAPPRAAGEGLRALPADSTTRHKIVIGGREREFTATAGTVRLSDAQTGAPQADIAYMAFQLVGEEPRKRALSFAFNGGPGYASAWLNLGALGPWRLPMDGGAVNPSSAPVVVDNPDTWLEFTDLVFLDPAGTGYSRILGNDEVRKNLWSVSGDIASLAVTIRRWTEANGRGASPKYLVGESYGGFRAPKIARALQTDQGVGVNGLVLVAPVLDFRRFDAGDTIFNAVARLPSYAATVRERKGPITRDALKDVEDYARGEYLTDLVRGVNDKAALARLTKKVSELTGLDPALVERLGGRIPGNVFAREINRGEGRISSGYDTNVTSVDPYPQSLQNAGDDQMLNGLHAPIIQTMVDLYRERLKWTVENTRYLFRNDQAGRQWEGRPRAEATDDLRRALALDPTLRVLVTHGMTDIVTPYFETRMVLDQLPDFGTPERIRFVVYPGGHMAYTREASRKAMRDDARKLMDGK